MIYLLHLWSLDVLTWKWFVFNVFFPPVSALRRINAIIRIAMAPRPYSYLHCPLANPRWALGGCVSQHLFPIWPSTYPFVHISLVCWKLLWSWMFVQVSWTATAWPNSVFCSFAHLRLQTWWEDLSPRWNSKSLFPNSLMKCRLMQWFFCGVHVSLCRGTAWLWHQASIRCQVSLRFHSIFPLRPCVSLTLPLTLPFFIFFLLVLGLWGLHFSFRS